MKENMLEVLMYLFENYMTDRSEFEPDHDTLTAELSQAGFADGEINKAFGWLEDLSEMCGQPHVASNGGSDTSIRHFTSEERRKLDRPARGLLLSLERLGVLDPTTREMVIDRAMALDTDEMDLEHLKWVIMMVLCNQPGREEVCAWAEELILTGVHTSLH